MRCRFLFVGLVAAASMHLCLAQDSTKETVEKIDRVRASDARNASTANTPGGMSRAEVDELARKLVAGFPTRSKEIERQPSPAEERRLQAKWAARDELVAQARAGDPDANLFLGKQHYNGSEWNFVDHAGALRYFLTAAMRRDEALFLAGRMIYQGDATPADEERGRSMMDAAANDGFGEAKEFLASHPRVARTEHFPSMLTRMTLPPADGPQTEGRSKLWKTAYAVIDGKAKSPSSQDYLEVASVYSRGLGVPRDLGKAREYALRAIAGGLSNYVADQAHRILMDYALVHREQDPAAFAAEADAYFAADGRLPARYYQAAAACMHKDYVKQRYLLGQAVTTLSYDPLSKAPPMAHVDLGLMQIAGEGGPVDEVSGINNLLADRANPEAQYYIGHFLANGTHLQKKDPVNARTWLEAAAKGGQQDAVRELGEMNNANANR